MRTLIVVISLLVFSAGIQAVEPVTEQQVMLYYHIPLGADRQGNNKHRFGLRLDQTTHNPGEVVQIDMLESRPAALDFRMDYEGVQSVKFHGVDYAGILVARAAEGEAPPVETESGAEATAEPVTEGSTAEPEAAAETPAPEGEAAPPAETEEQKQEKTIVQQKLDALPFGMILGVLLGVAIIAGVGG